MAETRAEFHKPLAVDAAAPKLMAVFAHPDDETFIAGGTLAQHAQKGWQVTLVCVTHGEAGSAGREGLDLASYKKRRTQELRQATKLLGVDKLILWDWGDGQVAQRPHPKAVAELVEIMQRIRPHVVITFGPDGISGHPDHVAISRLTTKAFRQYCVETVDQAGEPQLYYVVSSAAVPACCRKQAVAKAPPVTTTIDIGSAWPRKLSAMQAYRSQRHLLKSLAEETQARHLREEMFHLVLFDE